MTTAYIDREDSRTNSYHQKKREASQDVWEHFGEALERGPLNWDRRNACEFDFLNFCTTYGGEAFRLEWSPNHRKAAKRVEEATINGEKFAFAMPRGSGKTTLSRWAVVWAALYGHSAYSVLIGKTAHSAEKLLKSIKTSLRFNDLLLEDFPEAIAPIRHLKGETRRAQGQKYRGEPTMIEWMATQIVLAQIPVPYAKCCGNIIDVAGIEGEIRGRQFERPDGTIVRPQLAVVDDPQDRETAKSVVGCERIVQTIKSDIAYLAGPDAATGVLIPCTVIYDKDAAHQLLNRKENPEFQGETTKLMVSFPTNERLWEQYRRIREESLENGNKGREANEFYAENLEAMNAGAEVSWPARFFPDELSGIQHAMNRFFADESAFFAEYQNEPKRSTTAEVEQIPADTIAGRMSGVPQRIVPNECNKLTAFIDISEKCLWWAVVAWGDGFTGSVIDYGVYPEQRTQHVTLASVKQTLEQQASKANGLGSIGFEAALKWGLETLTDDILGSEYLNESGTPMQVSKCLIDSNWHRSTAVVNAFCRRSEHRKILLPTRGRGVTSPDDGLINPRQKRQPGELRGNRWKVLPVADNAGFYLLYDTNYWKTFVHSRLSVAVGDPGALSLFQADRRGAHKMIAEQLTAEKCERLTIRDCELDRWTVPPHVDNHFFDAVVGCAVAASMLGVNLPSVIVPRRKKAPRREQTRRRGASSLAC